MYTQCLTPNTQYLSSSPPSLVHSLMLFRNVALAAGCCLILGCSHKITSHTFPARDIIPSSPVYALDLPGARSPIQMLYLGCGHLVIEYAGETIVTDPFFSIQSFSPGGNIASSVDQFARYKSLVTASGLDMKNSKSVWLAHTHYDHMMDLPMMIEGGMVPPTTAIYGNSNGEEILGNFLSPNQYHSLQTVYDPGKSRGTWIDSASSIRVLPIRSEHAPHMRMGPLQIHLMKGDLKPGYFGKTLKTVTSKTKQNAWTEGSVYSFLVDFVQKDTIEYRIFIQTSASHYPVGLPSQELLAQRPVDVAVLCLASSNTVKPYPVDMLRALKPQKTIFIHWEDFFERATFGNYRLVRLTNFRKITKRMAKEGMPLTKDKFVMPQPGTLITIK